MPKVPVNQTIPNAFIFNIPVDSAVTSAAVYNTDGLLIRTLWANEPYAAGNHTGYWDGNDDNGNQQTSGLYFDIKVHSNNNIFLWEGVIGNNSTDLTGSSVWRYYGTVACMREVGAYMYFGTTFSEGDCAQGKFLKSAPNKKIRFRPYQTSPSTYFITANGTNVFYGGKDYTATGNFIFATKVSDDSLTIFSAGQSYSGGLPFIPVQPSVLDLNTLGNTGVITGMDVQQSNNQYLYVAHANQNLINVYLTGDGSGSFVTAINITNPGNIFLENDSTLWISQGTTLTKYTVNIDGTITITGAQITGFDNIIGLSIHSGTIAVLDGITQQIVKNYNSTSLSLISTVGQLGGYISSEVVHDNKFYLHDLGAINSFVGYYPTYLAHQSDGSFWLGDTGNWRNQHFDSSGNYQNNIMFIPRMYDTNICLNQNTAVFANLLEYTIDYSQPITSGWTLTNNWGYNIPNGWFSIVVAQRIALLSNARRYVILHNASGANTYMGELVANQGIRIGNLLPAFCDMDSNGNLSTYTFATPILTYHRYLLTGFDGSHNPIYAAPINGPVLNLGAQYPRPSGQGFPLTDNGDLILFDNTKNGPRVGTLPIFKLASFNPITSQPNWAVAISTWAGYSGDYIDNGTFDITNQVINPGGSVQTVDNNIFWGYHGENWKQQQTGIFYMYDDNGLFKGIAGILGPQISAILDEAPIGYASNSLTINVTKVGGDYYVYFNDESKHSGVHRWKVTPQDENTQTINFILDDRQFVIAPTKIDLLSGVPEYSSVQGLAGWSQSPAIDVTTGTNRFYTNTRVNVFDLSVSPDVQLNIQGLNFAPYFLKRNIPLSNLSNWIISGQLQLSDRTFNGSESIGAQYQKSWFEVTDNTGKSIIRIYFYQTGRIAFNNVFYTPTNPVRYGASDFVISTKGSNIYLLINLWGEWLSVTQPMYDLSADVTNPASISCNFTSSQFLNVVGEIGINELFLEGDNISPIVATFLITTENDFIITTEGDFLIAS